MTLTLENKTEILTAHGIQWQKWHNACPGCQDTLYVLDVYINVNDNPQVTHTQWIDATDWDDQTLQNWLGY